MSTSFNQVKAAVFPVAGLGSRFLPATKTVPKEMLPIVDRPLIQYAVDEAVEAGCDTLVFVTNRYKHAVADYFDTAYELESRLEKAGKIKQLERVRKVLPDHVRCAFVTQPHPKGLGDAVLRAKAVIGNQPFAVMLPDDLIFSREQGVLAQMCEVAKNQQSSVIAVQEVPQEKVSAYGVVATDDFQNSHGKVSAIVEKPPVEEAPSNLAVVGRYILSPEIFDILETTPLGRGNELQLTDAIATMLKQSPLQAYRFKGMRFDCGTHLGLVEATIRFALDNAELSDGAREAMQRSLAELGIVEL